MSEDAANIDFESHDHEEIAHDDNKEEQEMELELLQSIFVDEIADIQSDPPPRSVEILVYVDLPEEQGQVQASLPNETKQTEAPAQLPGQKLERSISGRRLLSTFPISFLPPLRLSCVFPPDYPTTAPPKFTLSARWLTASQLTCLVKELDREWEENEGEQIVYTWVEWLQSNCLATFGLKDIIELHPQEPPGLPPRDPRAMFEGTNPLADLMFVLQYDSERANLKFMQEEHTCEICYDDKLGSEFIRLDSCGHMFCSDCVKMQCEIHIKDGTIQELHCPEPGCTTEISVVILKALVSAELFDRWERLCFQQLLDADEDIAYCPRCSTAATRVDELARCPKCMFAFCVDCQESYHPGTPCETAETKLDKLKKSPGNKSKLSERLRKIEELQGLKTISRVCKACPSCKAQIEKDGGCNKMTCFKCGTYFCWLCGKSISGYDHFQDGKCVLFQAQPVAPALMQRERPLRALLMEAVLRENVNVSVKRCPGCRQRNLKECENNQLKCWACKTSFCFVCGAKIKKGSNHFQQGGCAQHTPL
eukprot:m.64893 g.64893  ORF g.64893 m.64893 type:complete len:537 (-) comp19587_c0_seq1:54-1664(-)